MYSQKQKLLHRLAMWKRECITGTIQPNFFKGGISSVKFKKSSGKLNQTGGYFRLDGQYSLDYVEDKINSWISDGNVGNMVIYCSCGEFVGIHEEVTEKL